MLHRSFKPAKCKTALKLAIPRIKLMKNRREVQVQHLKRELAQLLESGQDQTARIRVEHVVREEKTVAAYNLLEIYCELIVARMPIIESQKNCPIDLKEAISSVVFASARCDEIPELKDISKQFTAKYGKEFTSSTLELRPNCGVGRMLVEKLSANAPDGPTKLKILTAIAEEHKINWNPESFGAKESKIYDDMLNGPNATMEDTKISANPSIIQASPSHEQRPPSVQLPNNDKEQPHVQDSKHLGKSDAPTSYNEHNSRSSLHPNKFDHSNTSTNNSMSYGTYPPNSKPHGIENQGMEYRNSYSGNKRLSSLPRQHWEMEFKDATAAAQAAAESAERASMAARAAAELSSRGNISHQHPMEPHMSSPHSMKDEELQKYASSSSQNEQHARHPVNNSHHGRNSGDYEHNNVARSSDKSTHSSFMSTAASFNEKASVNDETADAYSQINKSEGRQMEHFSKSSINSNSGKNGMQFVNELHDIKDPQNLDHHEVGVRDQSSYFSSYSQSNTSTDDQNPVSDLNWQQLENDERNSGESRMQFENELNETKTNDDHDVVSDLNHQKFQNDSDEDLFLPNDKGSLPRSMKETTGSFDNASAVFDDYGSDNYEDNFGLEEKHIVHEYNMDFSSPGQRSPTHPFTTPNSWSVQQNNSSPEKSISKSHIFSEEQTTPAFFESSTRTEVPSNVDDLPATFDDYGPSSESEEEVDKSKFASTSNFHSGSDKENLDSDKPENSSLTPQLAEDIEDNEHSNESSVHKQNLDSHKPEKSSFTPQLAEGIEDTEHSNKSSLEESKELKFGTLTGGLRNKGSRYPPYSKISRNNVFSHGEAATDASTGMKQSSSPAAVEVSVSSGSYNQEPYNRKGNDDGSEEQPKETFTNVEDQYSRTSIIEENKKSSLRGPIPYFDSGNSDSDEDLPKVSLKAHSNTSLSRRTKASLPYSRRSSNHRTTVSSEPAVVLDHGGQKNLTSRSSDADEAIPKRQPQKKNIDHQESSQHSWLAPQSTSMPVSETKGSSVGGTSKSSEKEQLPAPVRKTSTSGSVKSLNAKTSIGEGSSKESATHVHPKLPDYEAYLPYSRRSSDHRTTVSSEPAVVLDHAMQKNLTSRSSDADEAIPKRQPRKKNIDHQESSQHSWMAPQPTSMPVSETKGSSVGGTSKSSEKERQSAPWKSSTSGSVKSYNAKTSIGEGSSKETATHVHPKLPDYDSLTAHLNSLRRNR